MADVFRVLEIGDEFFSGSNVIKADNYRRLLKAEEILAEAKQQAAQIVQDAEAGYHEQLAAGKAEGLQQAETEASQQAVETTEALRAHLKSLREPLIDLVSNLIGSIVQQMPKRELIEGLVKSGLKDLMGQSKVAIEVHPSDAGPLTAAIDEICQSTDQLEMIEVIPEQRAKPGTCILKTDWHVVDASLSTQLDSLRTALAHIEVPGC